MSGGANGGTVQFFDGDNPLEDAVPVTGGSASISPTFTEDGPHSITASYSGAPGFLASTSASAKIVTVTTDAPPDAVTTTATVSPSTAKVGQDVNLTAKVDPQVPAAPSISSSTAPKRSVLRSEPTELPSLRTPSPRPERTRLSRSSRAHQDSRRPLPRHSRSV